MDELDRYLSTGHIKDVTDPLSWWVENKGTYPRLWWMAWDYLTIPGELSHTITLYRVLADKAL
jgi:hAT family C-terminal dimerisation region